MRRISVVLPVYNERESIAPCLRGLASALAGEEHEILVCHDTDEDTTLPAIAAMPDRPASVRLVRNTLGRGALNAIRSGFAAASGDVVVTSMADLSDPPELIPRMAEKIRDGADVVAGSRYMRGGSQKGGPWLKRTLSRIAGVSLRWISGIGTHDSTSNFRAYSKTFLDSVTIESRAGFEIALELTVKAHLAGRKVDEVPSSWVERESGKSNFKLWKWLPSYLRWYLRAAIEPAIVLGIWLAMTISGLHLVAAHGSPVPYMDDYVIVDGLAGRGSDLRWLWAQHNEHRIPVPKILSIGAVGIAHDFRSPMYLQVGVLAIASLALILAARRIRGRTRAADAFFPMLLLHWGHYENLLCAFQVAFVLPAAIVCGILAFVAGRSPIERRRSAPWIAAGLFLLPLCGAVGLIQAIPIALWAAIAGAVAWRSGDASERTTGRRLVLGAAAAGFLVALYLATFANPRVRSAWAEPWSAALETIDLLARGVGPFPIEARPTLRALVLLVTSLTLAAEIVRWRLDPKERRRRLGLLSCGAGLVALAAAIALGRGVDAPSLTAPRYVTLFAPFLALLYLAWCRRGERVVARVVHAGLCLGMVAALPTDLREGRAYAERRRSDADALVRDTDAGLEPEQLSEKHWKTFSSDEDRFTAMLEKLRHLGLAPYRAPVPGPPEDPRIVRPFSLWRNPPIELRSEELVTRRRAFGVWAIQLHAPSEVVFEIPSGARAVRIGFGIDPVLYSKPETSTKGVVFDVLLLPTNFSSEQLFVRTLDPVRKTEDRGIQRVTIPLPADACGRLEVRLRSTGDGDPRRAWGFLTEVEFD